MLKDITIDSIMKDYYCCICSDKLSEDKIDIDDTLEVEDSLNKYLQLFSAFLNESLYRGYIISEPIIKKLMDVGDYEGFEFQILEKYTDILFSAMNDCKCDENNRPVYREQLLSPKDSIAFVNDYIDGLHKMADEETEVISTMFPRFNREGSTEEAKELKLYLLQEEDYPINLMYKTIVTSKDISRKELIETVYVIYKNNIDAYRAIAVKYNDPYILFFLLDSEDDTSMDIITNYTNSFLALRDLIGAYTMLNDSDISESAIKNIKRLINLLSINITIEQTAMIIGTDYDWWKKFDEENHIESEILTEALTVYDQNRSKLKMMDPIEYIYSIKNKYPGDEYFYARNTILNMDYSTFCNFIIPLYNELKVSINSDLLLSIYTECVEGLVNLRNKEVDNDLIKTHNRLKEIIYSLEQDDDKYIVMDYTDSLTEAPIGECDKEDLENISKIIYDKLINRNGDFNPEIIPSEGDDVAPKYTTMIEGDSLLENKIFGISTTDIKTGSVFTNVKNASILKIDVQYEDTFLTESFEHCVSNKARYIAKYAQSEKEEETVDLGIACGDSNIRIKNKTIGEGKYLIGVLDVKTFDFIYCKPIKIEDNEVEVLTKLLKYSEQIKNNISGAREYAITTMREQRDAYFVTDDSIANLRLELATGFVKDDDIQAATLF